MSLNMCRLCRRTHKETTSSIDSDLIIQFLEYIPKIVFSDDPSLPINVCGGCLRKTEDSFSFIKSIEKSQDAFSRQSEAKNPKSSSATSSAHAILKKMKEIGSVSIRRLALPPANEVVTDANAIKAENDDPLIYSKEIEDFKIEEDCDVATIEASSDYSYHASDSDDEYKPKKPRIALSAALPKSKPVQKTSKDFYIDAPISFTCAQCKASFDDFCTLSRHMKERSCIEEEIHMCTICEKQFKNKRNLQNHMRVHRPKETIMCEGCGLPFKSQYDLDQHSEAIHRRVVKMDCIFRCAHCPETFNSHLDLLEHVKKHGRGAKDDEPRLCEICAKECINLRSYKAHMLKHRDVLPFVCNICNKGFERRYRLDQHMHVHTGIKMFSCKLCDKNFAKADSLRVHTRKYHTTDSE